MVVILCANIIPFCTRRRAASMATVGVGTLNLFPLHLNETAEHHQLFIIQIKSLSALLRFARVPSVNFLSGYLSLGENLSVSFKFGAVQALPAFEGRLYCVTCVSNAAFHRKN
jgi:hypothetical protein